MLETKVPEFPAKVEVDPEAFNAVKQAIRGDNPRFAAFWWKQFCLLFSRRY
jgi:hypothetical protein